MRVLIQRAIPLTIHMDGSTIHTRTRGDTVADVLAQEEVSLWDQDYVVPAESTALSANMAIRVVRVREETIVEQEAIPFETAWTPDAELELDQRRVERAGQPGIIARRFRIHYEDGQVITRTLEEEWRAQEPQSRLLAYGSRIVSRQVDTPDGPRCYWRKVRVLVTSYSAATAGKSPDHPHYGVTRLGWRMRRGIVAVDPRVINFGTRVYVPGYGEGVAGDTGGKIRGRHIDLGYDESDLQLWYKWVEVYLLDPPPPRHQIRWVLPDWPREGQRVGRAIPSARNVPHLLRELGLRPRKELGQHLLTDQRALARIVAAAELTDKDVVIEVGAGLGALTHLLAQAAERVIAVELDRDLALALSRLLALEPQVTIVQGDILQFSPADLLARSGLAPHTPYLVVGNLPYAITSAILRHFLEAEPRPRRLVVTVQREVAERVTARPGEMSLLGVSVQFYGRPQIVLRLKPGAFYPPPVVSSVVIRIDCYADLPLSGQDPKRFFRIVRAGFAQRRKQLHNSLAAGLALPDDRVRAALQGVGIDPRRRAQTLSLEEWAAVYCALSPHLPMP